MLDDVARARPGVRWFFFFPDRPREDRFSLRWSVKLCFWSRQAPRGSMLVDVARKMSWGKVVPAFSRQAPRASVIVDVARN